MIKKRWWLKIQWSYKYVNSKAEETAADVQADISFFNPLGGKYFRFLYSFMAAVLRILILDPLDISTLNQVSFKMFPIGFSTILPSISSPLSPQGKYHSLLMVITLITKQSGREEVKVEAQRRFFSSSPSSSVGGWGSSPGWLLQGGQILCLGS